MSAKSCNARLIAAALAGSWRASPSLLNFSQEELETVTPSLLQTGAGGLGWWRIQSSALATSPPGSELQQAYRLHTLQAARHRRDIEKAFMVLRSAGLEPLLVKGWAIARVYPQQGLRPYGDIDLCVRPAEYQRAKEILTAGRKDLEIDVDLHSGFAKLDHRSWSELYERCQLLRINQTDVRVPGAEDHLRILCYHFLREGGWRPLWLCDIAATVELIPSDFDWDLFLGADKRQRNWFICTIALAHELLTANVQNLPAAAKTMQLPSWLVPAVLKSWEVRAMARRHNTPMARAWRDPGSALSNLRSHWPNPIEGTVGMSGSFNEMPRLPYQVGNCLLRTVDFVRHLPQMLRDQ